MAENKSQAHNEQTDNIFLIRFIAIIDLRFAIPKITLDYKDSKIIPNKAKRRQLLTIFTNKANATGTEKPIGA